MKRRRFPWWRALALVVLVMLAATLGACWYLLAGSRAKVSSRSAVARLMLA